MSPIYILVGTPGSGKTWIAGQLEAKFDVVYHDAFIGMDYTNELMRRARLNRKPVLGETPFSVTRIVEPLEAKGFTVHPVFVIESDTVTKERYRAREGRDIPQGHLTRIGTYRIRAKELGARSGTSLEILNYLRSI